MRTPSYSSVYLFYRPDNKRAIAWAKKIRSWLQQHHIKVATGIERNQLVIVLGGDGTILEASRQWQQHTPLILGFNLGSVGFLASARKTNQFIPALEQVITKRVFTTVNHMVLDVSVMRAGKTVATLRALNELLVQNPLSIVNITVRIEGYVVQTIRGTGVLIATSTGSTAYNLSAHGPIIVPNMQAMIVSEILDHNLPTPSIVLDGKQTIELEITDFRSHGLLSLTSTKEPVDVIASVDGGSVLPLQKHDRVFIQQSSQSVRFIELEPNYFFKSLQEKFSFT